MSLPYQVLPRDPPSSSSVGPTGAGTGEERLSPKKAKRSVPVRIIGRLLRAPRDLPAYYKLSTIDRRARAHFKKYPPIFIVGAPRSGTTLLLQVLSTQPLCTRNWEPFRLWEQVFGHRPDDANLGKVTRQRQMALRTSFFSKIEDGRPILVSKDPRDSLRVAMLARVFPTARFVHIVRDGRDVTASIVKAFEKGGKYQVEPGWVHVRFPGYRGRLSEPHHRKAAHMWRTCVEAVVRDFAAVPLANQATVRYEDLVSKAMEEGSRLLRMLWPGCSLEALMELVPFISDKVSASAGGEGVASRGGFQAKWVESNVAFDAGSGTLSSSVRIGKWQGELSGDVLDECQTILGPMMSHFGYR